MYVAAENLKAAAFQNCADGLFRASASAFGQITALVITDAHARYAIFLEEGPQQFTFYAIDQSRLRGGGILFAEPRIEVDMDSAFDADRTEALGDLVFTGGGPAVVARSGGNSWADPMRFPLWGSQPGNEGVATGFKQWRLVTGPSDQPVVVWERKAPAAE